MERVIIALQRAFGYMKYGKQGVYDLKEFVGLLELNHGEQQDPQEFNKLFLERVIEQLKLPPIDGKRLSFSQLVSGKDRNVITCQTCKTRKHQEHQFYEIEVSIQGYSQLETAIEGYFAEERLEGDNMYQCTRCNRKRNAVRATEIIEAPTVLYVQLLRYIYDRKLQEKKKLMHSVAYPSVLTFHGARYKLVSVLFHKGRSAYGGHYVCDVYDWRHAQWFHCDDEVVVRIEDPATMAAGKSSVVSEAKDIIDLDDELEQQQESDVEDNTKRKQRKRLTPSRKQLECEETDDEGDESDFQDSPHSGKRKRAAKATKAKKEHAVAGKGNKSGGKKAASKEAKEDKGLVRFRDAYMLCYVQEAAMKECMAAPRMPMQEVLESDIMTSNEAFEQRLQVYEAQREELMRLVEQRRGEYCKIQHKLLPDLPKHFLEESTSRPAVKQEVENIEDGSSDSDGAKEAIRQVQESEARVENDDFLFHLSEDIDAPTTNSKPSSAGGRTVAVYDMHAEEAEWIENSKEPRRSAPIRAASARKFDYGSKAPSNKAPKSCSKQPSKTVRPAGNAVPDSVEFHLVPAEFLRKWITGDASTMPAAADLAALGKNDVIGSNSGGCCAAKEQDGLEIDEALLLDDDSIQFVGCKNSAKKADAGPDLSATMIQAGVLNTRQYLCPHGEGLLPAHAESFKAISNAAFKVIFPSGTSPAAGNHMSLNHDFTHRNFRCPSCFDNAVARHAEASNYLATFLDIQLKVEHSPKAQGKQYLLAKTWMTDLKRAIALLEKMEAGKAVSLSKKDKEKTAHSATGSNTIDLYMEPSAESKQAAAGMVDVSTILATVDRSVNSAITCCHGRLSVKRKNTFVTVSLNAWRAIKAAFPAAREFAEDQKVCGPCAEEEELEKLTKDSLKEQRQQEVSKKYAEELCKAKRIYPRCFDEDETYAAAEDLNDGQDFVVDTVQGKKFFVVESKWLIAWRRFIGDTSVPRPGPMTNETLRCVHGMALIPAVLAGISDQMKPELRDVSSYLVSTTYSEGEVKAELVTEKQWMFICSQYPCVEEEELQPRNDEEYYRGKKRPEHDADGPFVVLLAWSQRDRCWKYEPDCCVECMNERASRHEEEQTMYRSSNITVKVVDAEKDLPGHEHAGGDDFIEEGATRRSARRAGGRRGKKSCSVNLGCDEKLFLVKMSIYQSLDIEPGQQRLFTAGGKELTDGSLSLFECGIHVNDTIYCLCTDSEGGFELLDVWHNAAAKNRKETGFGGTALFGGGAATTATASANNSEAASVNDGPMRRNAPNDLTSPPAPSSSSDAQSELPCRSSRGRGSYTVAASPGTALRPIVFDDSSPPTSTNRTSLSEAVSPVPSTIAFDISALRFPQSTDHVSGEKLSDEPATRQNECTPAPKEQHSAASAPPSRKKHSEPLPPIKITVSLQEKKSPAHNASKSSPKSSEQRPKQAEQASDPASKRKGNQSPDAKQELKRPRFTRNTGLASLVNEDPRELQFQADLQRALEASKQENGEA